MTATIVVPDDDPSAPEWVEIVRLSSRGDQWTLVGGLMVQSFLHEHGRPVTRATLDIDALMAVQTHPDQPERFAARLVADGYRVDDHDVHDLLDGRSMAHRFRRHVTGVGDLVVDVLVPGDGSTRRDPTTVGNAAPARVRGGTYALNRAGPVTVACRDTTGTFLRPDLLGALLIKSRAAVLDTTSRTARHRHDLAVLYDVLDDPLALREDLSTKQRRYLRSALALVDWDVASRPGQAQAAATLLSSPQLPPGPGF